MTNALPMRPTVRAGVEYGRHTFGRFTVVLYKDIVSPDLVEYAFVAPLFEEGNGDPVLFFTSERNRGLIATLLRDLDVSDGSDDGGSHFFCVFDRDGHSNYGASDDWGDAGRFERKVLDELEGAAGLPG